jgi:hypothetical protein
MKIKQAAIALSVLGGLTLPLGVSAQSIVDQSMWDATNRTSPGTGESAWFASSRNVGTESFDNGNLVIGWSAAGGSAWGTTFSPSAPVSLAINETLKISMTFTPNGAINSGANTNRRFRLGLFDLSAAGRFTAEPYSDNGGPSGTNATGYFTSINFANGTFSANTGMEIRWRHLVENSSLLGSETTFTVLETGGTTTGGTAFGNKQYVMTYEVTRTGEDSLSILTSFWNEDDGIIASLAAVAGGSAFSNSFDSLSLRANNGADLAESFTIHNFSVGVIPEPSTYALFAGIGGLALVMLRRRMSR